MSAQDNWESRRRLEEEIIKMETVDRTIARPTVPAVTLAEKTYDAPTDSELTKQAEDSLKKYREDGIAEKKAASVAEQKELDAKRTAAGASRDERITALRGDYDAAAKSIDNDALRRGLARSSIAASEKAELEREYIKKADGIRAEYGKQIDALNTEISELSGKLKKALDDFNIAYAAKLNEKLSSLKTERDKKQDEVIKYNNEVRAKQAELDMKRMETESKLYSDALEQTEKARTVDTLSPKEREALDKAIYDKLDAYLSTFNEVDAKREFLNHSVYKNHLPASYYYKLYDKYGR